MFTIEIVNDIIHRWFRVPHLLHIGKDIQPREVKATIVFVHGLANSHAMWDEIIQKIDAPNVRLISVDLLGFGGSPKPTWQTYSALVHARSLRLTLKRLRVKSPVLLVGHSLGTLVAIQYAKKYPSGADGLLLCNPPFYKPSKLAKEVRIGRFSQPDDAYHLLYRNSRYRHELSKRIALFMKTAKLVSRHFSISDETMPAIISSLEMSIENQTALEDAKGLKVPTRILIGRFDPFIIKSHIKELRQANPYVSDISLPVSHEIMGPIYKNSVVKHADALIKEITR